MTLPAALLPTGSSSGGTRDSERFGRAGSSLSRTFESRVAQTSTVIRLAALGATPAELVARCRDYVSAAAARYGATRVDASNAVRPGGAADTVRVLMTVYYPRRGGTSPDIEIKRAFVTCRAEGEAVARTPPPAQVPAAQVPAMQVSVASAARRPAASAARGQRPAGVQKPVVVAGRKTPVTRVAAAPSSGRKVLAQRQPKGASAKYRLAGKRPASTTRRIVATQQKRVQLLASANRLAVGDVGTGAANGPPLQLLPVSRIASVRPARGDARKQQKAVAIAPRRGRRSS